MPSIPLYQQRTNVSGNVGPGPNARSGAGMLGAALGNVAQDAETVVQLKKQQVQRAQQEADQSALIDANSTEMSLRSRWAESMVRRKQEAPPGADGFVPQVLDEYDTETAETLKGVKNQKARNYLQERFADIRLSLQNDALQFESGSRSAYKKGQLESSTNSAMTAARLRPQDFDSILMAQQGVMSNIELTEAERAGALPAMRSSIASAAVEGLIERDPHATLKALRDEKAGGAVGALDYGARDRLINDAEGKIRQIEAKREAAIAKRDGQAERALNEIDRQLSSGIPATAQMWSDWGNKVAGTTFEQDFKDRVHDEREVQTMLRLPVDQQLKYVQDKRATLMSGGDTLREATNLQRLGTAVEQNVKLMTESPLQFNANRLGETVAPLDIGDIVAGDAAPQLQSRIDTLAGMRKQYGDQVPMQVLLPQEAQQLSAALQKATPKQQSELFASLHNAVGDTQVYKSVMQQIAPDSPVRAMAGMLAANQAQLTTANHWFKPDEIKYSGDVSATLLQGEAMLNASKDDKGSDGKTNAKLYLPESTSLQTDFQNKVGTAFTGRPEAAQVAFQAIKAYYVGRAAQIGRMAASGKDIDSALVKEAITATLGSVVDFNGNGEVLAPWGMDKPTFLDKAQAAMVAEGKRQGLGTQQLNAFGESGLRQASANTYYVVQGRSFVYGKDGKPIVVTVSP